MKSAFLLQHLHVTSENSECVKVIGLYASKEDAVGAIERLKSQPGFADGHKLIDSHENEEESGFYIDEYEIGKDHWTKGYVTA